MKGHRKLGIIIVLSFLLWISCKTAEKVIFIQPPLPEFTINKPTRPKLLAVEDGIQLPVSVLTNQILLQGYAKELEAYAAGWEEFYMKVREEYASDKRDQEDNR